jgi:hypothetical protein
VRNATPAAPTISGVEPGGAGPAASTAGVGGRERHDAGSQVRNAHGNTLTTLVVASIDTVVGTSVGTLVGVSVGVMIGASEGTWIIIAFGIRVYNTSIGASEGMVDEDTCTGSNIRGT